MARFGIEDAEKYGGQGGGGYFSLKNDHDVAKVRFLFDGIQDVEGFAVHEVEIDGRKRYVNCLRDYGQPVDVCPFCASGKFTMVKYFVPLFNIKENRLQTWERGKKFGQKLSSLCSRYPHLVSHIFEIERNGQSGDMQTAYEIYEVGSDNTTIADFEVPNPLGGIVLDKTADDMTCYLNTGYFPDGGTAYNNQPVTRRGGTDISRRTPNGGDNNGGRRQVF